MKIMFRAICLSAMLSFGYGPSAFGQDFSIGDRVYALFGRHESAAKVRGGNVVQPGESNSYVEFDSCIPECYKWMDNLFLYPSKYKAQEVAKSLDENHTSLGEGLGMALGAAIVVGVIAATSEEETLPEEPKFSDSDDTTLKPID